MGSEGYSFIPVKPTNGRSNIQSASFSLPDLRQTNGFGGHYAGPHVFRPTVIICSASARPGINYLS